MLQRVITYLSPKFGTPGPIKTTYSYTLHQQALETKTRESPKPNTWLGVELAEDLHWGEHIKATTAKGNKTCAFMYTSLKGSPPHVHSYCCYY